MPIDYANDPNYFSFGYSDDENGPSTDPNNYYDLRGIQNARPGAELWDPYFYKSGVVSGGLDEETGITSPFTASGTLRRPDNADVWTWQSPSANRGSLVKDPNSRFGYSFQLPNDARTSWHANAAQESGWDAIDGILNPFYEDSLANFGLQALGMYGGVAGLGALAGGAAAGAAEGFDLYGGLNAGAGAGAEAWGAGAQAAMGGLASGEAAGAGYAPGADGIWGGPGTEAAYGSGAGAAAGAGLAPVVEMGKNFSGAFQTGNVGSDIMSIMRSVLGIPGGGGGTGLGGISGLISAGNSIYGLYQADQMKKLTKLMMKQSDSWGSSGGRDIAAGQLAGVLSGGSDAYEQTPAYKARMQAVQRSMAANGYLGSGNMAAAAAAAGGAGYNEYLQQMGNLAGAGQNPATSAQIGITGNSAANNLAVNSLGLLAKTAALRNI